MNYIVAKTYLEDCKDLCPPFEPYSPDRDKPYPPISACLQPLEKATNMTQIVVVLTDCFEKVSAFALELCAAYYTDQWCCKLLVQKTM